jgi:hypothetical protein
MTGSHGFLNRRAAMWWMFREALDPNSNRRIALPPSSRLRTELCAARYIPKGKDYYQVEDKEIMKTRLNGRSPDEAEAVLLAWYTGERRTVPRITSQTMPVTSNMGHMKFKQMYRKQMRARNNQIPYSMDKQGNTR